MIGRSCQAPLLELARHRDDPLDRRRNVLACRSAAPGIRPRPSVGEDAPRDEQRVLVLGAQLGQLVELVRQVDVGFDVGLGSGGADEGVVALRAEEEADRLGEDRLARAGLPGDRVQSRREVELGLPDEHEILDSQPSQHRSHRREGIRRRLPSVQDEKVSR